MDGMKVNNKQRFQFSKTNVGTIKSSLIENTTTAIGPAPHRHNHTSCTYLYIAIIVLVRFALLFKRLGFSKLMHRMRKVKIPLSFGGVSSVLFTKTAAADDEMFLSVK